MRTLIAWWKRWLWRSGACRECRFWVGNSKIGECRRFPPKGDWDEELRWLMTGADEWCGEWRKK